MYNVYIYYNGTGDYKGQLVNSLENIDVVRIKKTKLKVLMDKTWLTFDYRTVNKFEIVKIDKSLPPED